MGLFVCNQCGVVENTALSNFWINYRPFKGCPNALCSQCDPDIRKWHGRFERKLWDGKSKVMNRIQIELNDTVYWVEPNTIVHKENGTMLCRAWTLNPIREEVHFDTLDKLARLVEEDNEKCQI